MDKEIEQRICLKFCKANGISDEEALKMLQKAYGESTPPESRAYESHNSGGNELFLGNLPPYTTKEKLKEVFVDFGAIIDLTIYSKSVNETGGIASDLTTLNYGIITFKTQQGMQNCLAARPIYFPKGNKHGTVLEVEEKITTDHPSYCGKHKNDKKRHCDNNTPRRGSKRPNCKKT